MEFILSNFWIFWNSVLLFSRLLSFSPVPLFPSSLPVSLPYSLIFLVTNSSFFLTYFKKYFSPSLLKVWNYFLNHLNFCSEMWLRFQHPSLASSRFFLSRNFCTFLKFCSMTIDDVIYPPQFLAFFHDPVTSKIIRKIDKNIFSKKNVLWLWRCHSSHPCQFHSSFHFLIFFWRYNKLYWSFQCRRGNIFICPLTPLPSANDFKRFFGLFSSPMISLNVISREISIKTNTDTKRRMHDMWGGEGWGGLL